MIDGKSFASILRGESDAASQRDWILSQYAHQRVVRGPRYKLRWDGRFHDLLKDPLEEHNLANSNDPKIVAERKRLQQVLDSLPPDAKQWFQPRSISARALGIGDASQAKLAPDDPSKDK